MASLLFSTLDLQLNHRLLTKISQPVIQLILQCLSQGITQLIALSHLTLGACFLSFLLSEEILPRHHCRLRSLANLYGGGHGLYLYLSRLWDAWPFWWFLGSCTILNESILFILDLTKCFVSLVLFHHLIFFPIVHSFHREELRFHWAEASH